MKILKCYKCGAEVEVINECTCDDGISCCGKKMVELAANSSDGAVEKHLPEYSIVDDTIEVVVNHPMDDDHYIERIYLVTSKGSLCYYLKPGDEAKASFPYEAGSTIYSLCNKHGLWSKEVE